MQRRDILKLAGTAAFARVLQGCDRLVVIEPRDNPHLDPITPNDQFYTYSFGPKPDLDIQTHQTVIAHEDEELARFDLPFLESLQPMDKEHTLECIGTNPRVQRIGNAVWSGLPLIDVMDALGVAVPASAVGLRLVGADTYHAGIPIEDLTEGPVWLVWRMNGEPLPFLHGAPARLLVPGRYGMKNLKWLTEIAFVDEAHRSYWTTRGWSEPAPYLPNTLIVNPLDGVAVVPSEAVRFVGTAFAGEDPVVAVEVSVDGGAWQPANLDYAPGPAIWALWSWDWTPQPGSHTVQVRCVTLSGAASVDDPGGTNRLNGYDGSMQITVLA